MMVLPALIMAGSALAGGAMSGIGQIQGAKEQARNQRKARQFLLDRQNETLMSVPYRAFSEAVLARQANPFPTEYEQALRGAQRGSLERGFTEGNRLLQEQMARRGLGRSGISQGLMMRQGNARARGLADIERNIMLQRLTERDKALGFLGQLTGMESSIRTGTTMPAAQIMANQTPTAGMGLGVAGEAVSQAGGMLGQYYAQQQAQKNYDDLMARFATPTPQASPIKLSPYGSAPSSRPSMLGGGRIRLGR